MEAMLNINPKAIPNKAANKTWYSFGKMNVSVCAGIQNSGMVFLNTKFHCTSQFKEVMIFLIGMGVTKDFKLPAFIPMCVSVILCKVINTGAKVRFIKTLMPKDPSSLYPENPEALNASCKPHKPILSKNIGTPAL